MLKEKGIFTKEKFLEMVRIVDPEIKRKHKSENKEIISYLPW
jgi:hypothetical protein